MALAALGACSFAHAATPSVPIMAASALHAGMVATVRTVFAGDSIETFNAEIVGVLLGGRAEGDQIIARATDARVARCGIAQGMSGSPVYVGGRLIGALSGGWSFVREPLFVITPIGEMLDVLDHPVQDSSGPTGGPAGMSAGEWSLPVRFGEFHWGDATDPPPLPGAELTTRAPAALRSTLSLEGGPTPLALPLAIGGLAPAASEVARRMFEPLGLRVTPGGRGHAAARPPAAAALEPGAACAVDVLRGDLDASAIGTVTYRDGDRVLLFGHPFFQSGAVHLPLSSASIVTIVPSEVASFKLGSPGVPLGTVTQDRRPAVAGRLGSTPALLPFGVTVHGVRASDQRYRFETIEDRSLMPQMISLAALNSMLEAGGTASDQTVTWTMRVYRHGSEPLLLHDVLASDSPVQEIPSAIGSPLRFLANNPFARLQLDSLSLVLTTRPGRDLWTLRNARVPTASVRPGGRVRVGADLEHWRGARRELTLDIAVPEELPAGKYVLWVGGAAELMRMEAARLPGRFRPISLDDAWQRVAGFRSSDRLYGLIVARAPEVTRGGRDYPELPNSALALLAGGQLAGDDARRGDRAMLSETSLAVDGVVRGELQIELKVDEQAP